MIREGSAILSAAKPKPEISKDMKLKRAGTTGLPDSCSFLMETVGVEGLEKSSTPIITRFSKNVGTFVGTLLYYLQKNQN